MGITFRVPSSKKLASSLVSVDVVGLRRWGDVTKNSVKKRYVSPLIDLVQGMKVIVENGGKYPHCAVN